MHWNEIVKFFQDIYPIINVVIAILWGIYVYFTIKTFREIHRQTELQSEAFLMVTCATSDSFADKSINKVSEASSRSHIKWTEIVKANIPAAVGPESYLVLTLTNKGRSDIVDWSIKMLLSISPGEYLARKFNIVGEDVPWNILSETSRDIIEAGQSILVLVAKVGSYPEGKFSWEIRYADMRSKKYGTFSGDKFRIAKNSLAFSMKDQ